jgi:uncharacterized protein (TIGR03435 family)
MLRTFVHCTFALVLSGLAFGQLTDSKPAFELADVHVSAPTRNPFFRNPVMRSGRYETRYATMVDLIRTAWGVEAERVVGGPSWLENDNFDIIAKAPAGTTVESAKPMLQALLTERFNLAIHNDTKPVLAFGLKTTGKRPAMKQSDGSGDTGCKFGTLPPPPPPPAPGGPPPPPPVFTWECRNITMEAFAKALYNDIFLASQYLNGKLVVDETELKGTWDFDFKMTPRGTATPNGSVTGAIALSDATEKLGLRLEPIEVPLPVIVVDSVNRKPTPNVPNIAELLHVPPPPKEFEVAELKPTDPDFRGMMLQVQPGGRVNIRGVPVKFLIQQAWNLNDDSLLMVPKWMETDRYDIVAKADVDGPQLDIDDLWGLLRALVIERFQMKFHMEDRPVTAYTLVAVKPKMKKADPNSRTKYKEGPGADGKDPRDKTPILSRLVTVQNMTMADFGAKLQTIAPGYIHAPVLDATGLEGGYDFTLSFSAVGLTMAPPGGAGRGGDPGPLGTASAASTASDPNGAVTLFEAIEKQLGLKLEAKKRPVSVLVIDSAEQKPIEN